MVDLARQAFSTNNFQLAAEIYERTIKENGPTADLYLGLANSCARGGNFRRAFEAYSHVSRIGKLSVENLKHLVTGLIETVKQENSGKSGTMEKNCMFTCAICRGLFNDPVTMPCGHTFCRRCCERDEGKVCKHCGTSLFAIKLSNIKTNILISSIVEGWFPNDCRAARLKREGNVFFERRKFRQAIELYTEAIKIAPLDHLLLSNRSHAYASLDLFKEALADAEEVLRLRPDWPKGFFRKGCALYGLDQYEDAVVALLQCLALDTSVSSAKNYLSKALHKILTPLPPDDPKSAAIQNQLNPSVLQCLIQCNFSSKLLLPQVTMDTIMQLKDLIRSTLSNATHFSEENEEIKPDFSQADVFYDCHQNEEVLSNNPSQSQPEDGSKCKSAPCSRPESPLLSRMERSNSLPQTYGDEMSRKRSRNTSSSSGAGSPVRKLPPKIQKAESFPVPMDVSEDQVKREEFDCSLCYRLLYEPVTTPCGHSFCRQCLDRCLDHHSICPLCKSSLIEYLAERRQAKTECIETIIKTYLPAQYEERKQSHEEEMLELAKMGIDNSHEIPIFVCTMAFPGMTCPLHIFEPRYRLMIRQCMESGTRQFGMCICTGENEEEFAEFGCMLEIRDVQYFPDGRSLVDCIGGRRFKVISRGKRDGYNTAKIEYISDTPVDPANVEGVQQLQQSVYQECLSWFSSLSEVQQQQITRHCGQFPVMDSDFQGLPNSTSWMWWMMSVLPLDPRIQLTMLAMVSYSERLEGLNRVIQYVKRKRSR